MTAPRFLPLGDSALTVEFGDSIAPDLMAAVNRLDATLTQNRLEGIIECVPTYRSLTVHFDPLRLPLSALEAHIIDCLAKAATEQRSQTMWRIPVCYEAPYALDKDEYEAQIRLSFDEAIKLHQQTVFTIAMFGFMPGCAYLAGLPSALHVPRRTTPRPEVPPGSIMIGGAQGLISSVAMPTGWYVIGRTPLVIFDANTNPVTPFNVGDQISFAPISAEEWDTATLDRVRLG